MGKTTTKHAVVTLLAQQYRVRLDEDHRGTEVRVPLGILGVDYPVRPRSVFSWLAVFRAAKQRIKAPADVDVIIQEFDTTKMGDIAHFGTYLRPTIGIVTGVTLENVGEFGSVEEVAKEELALANLSESVLINRDDVDGRFADFLSNAAINTYGTTSAAETRFEINDYTLDSGFTGYVYTPGFPEPFKAQVMLHGEHSLRPAMAAVAVALKLGITREQAKAGLSLLRPIPGRMNALEGMNGSTIIDDTYSSSPAAAAAAMQVLYATQSPQRIAVLGDMQGLGASSPDEHRKLGELCDPNLLAWVVTIGPESRQSLAPAARGRGCQVKSFTSALDAGAFTHGVLEEGAIVLVKGGQGDIFAEEAVKVMLHSTDDTEKLVRQSPSWIERKNKLFNRIPDPVKK